MSSETCWSCGEGIGRDHNYCTNCGAPVSSFRVRRGDGFLSQESKKYLMAVADGEISYPSDTSLDDDLEDSLQAQLEQDIEVGMVEFGLVCSAEENLLVENIDFSAIDEVEKGEREIDDFSPSLLGLVHVLNELVNNLPSHWFDVFRDEDSEKEERDFKSMLDEEFDKPV